MRRHVLKSVAIIAVLSLGASAFAAEGGKGKGKEGDRKAPDSAEMFKRLDKNADGKLAKDEMPERMQANFERLDTDKDGSVSEAEFKAAAERMRDAGKGKGKGGDGKGKKGPPDGSNGKKGPHDGEKSGKGPGDTGKKGGE